MHVLLIINIGIYNLAALAVGGGLGVEDLKCRGVD
jgi:hypothetical protein